MRNYSKTCAILRVPVLQASDTFGQLSKIKDLHLKNNVKNCKLGPAKGSDPTGQTPCLLRAPRLLPAYTKCTRDLTLSFKREGSGHVGPDP